MSGAGFESTRDRARFVWLGVDLVGLCGLAVLLALVWLPTFGGGWLWVTCLGGTLLGWGCGLASRHWRWGVTRTSLLVALAWFLLGGLLAMPSTCLGGFVPTGRTLHGLVTAPLTAWKELLTFDPPVGETDNLLCVPLLLAMAQGLAGALVSLRTRRPWLAWLPGALVLGFSAVLGTGVGVHPVAVAIATGTLVLAWTDVRLRTVRTQLVRSRTGGGVLTPLLGVAVIGAAALGTAALAPALRPSERPATLRDAVAQPLDLRDQPSPLQAFRADLAEGRRQATLFTVTGTVPKDAVVRLATLDAYDGLTYRVTNSADGARQVGQFRRVGTAIESPEAGDPVDVTIAVADLGGDWVPTLGSASRITFAGPRALDLRETLYYNKQTATALAVAGLRPGDSYQLTGRVVPRPSEQHVAGAAAGQVQLPAPQQVPDLVGEIGRQWRGSSTGGAALLKFEKQLRTGYLSHGLDKQAPSAPGHQAARIQALLQRSQLNPPTMVGDQEQYAVAMALLGLDAGVPCRVVQGYRLPASGAVTGNDVRAWTECQLEGLGWVLFDPTPTQELKKLPPESPPAPNKRVDAPPPRPEPPQAPPFENTLPTEDSKPPRKGLQLPWEAIGRWGVVVGIPLVFFIAPVVAVLLAKRRRRIRRQGAALAANRVAGAWAEVVDQARDLGSRPSPAATRSEQAEQLVLAHPGLASGADPIGLAKSVDEGVFRPEPVTTEQAAEVWQRSEGMIGVWRRQLPRWRWLRARLSTRSFRRYR